MDAINEGYETTGVPYYVRMVSGYQTLIGLTQADYRMLLAYGFGDEEVYLGLRKKTSASREYEVEVRAGLNTITMDSTPYFQLSLDEEPTAELKDRGFEEGREVDLCIKQSPYRIPSKQFQVDKVALDIFDENDPMLDNPDVWLEPEEEK